MEGYLRGTFLGVLQDSIVRVVLQLRGKVATRLLINSQSGPVVFEFETLQFRDYPRLGQES